MSFEAIPPAALPVISAIAAGVIGLLLWRLFKLALKVVAFVVFLILLGGVTAWWQPGLVGLGKEVVERQMGAPLPTVDQAKNQLQDRLEESAKKKAREIIREQVVPKPAVEPVK
jgi:hypothetical protein